MENNKDIPSQEKAVSDEMRAILIEKSESDVKYLNNVKEISNELKAAHPGENLYDYRLYHIMIGSTLPPRCVKFDLPDGSIESAIRKYGSKS